MDYTAISEIIETDRDLGSVSIKCPMCHGECLKHGTYCGKCFSSGVIWRPTSVAVPRFDEQEALTKAASLVIQALGLLATGTWQHEIEEGRHVAMMWTIDEAMSCAWDEAQADIGKGDINAVLWALGQCVKGLMEKERFIRHSVIEKRAS